MVAAILHVQSYIVKGLALKIIKKHAYHPRIDILVWLKALAALFSFLLSNSIQFYSPLPCYRNLKILHWCSTLAGNTDRVCYEQTWLICFIEESHDEILVFAFCKVGKHNHIYGMWRIYDEHTSGKLFCVGMYIYPWLQQNIFKHF